jgi:acyl transferase domain-containing protein/phosphopantetheinyl transferase (holo-ACP synthase)
MSSKSGLKSNSSVQGDVAIIGMACVFPKADNVQKYWENIVTKVDGISDPPQDRKMDEIFDSDSSENDAVYCQRGGYIETLPDFNALKHGIMPVAIDGAEPEHFLALQVANDALMDAGFPEKPLNRECTAVILGRGTYVSRGYVSVFQHGLAVRRTIHLLKELHPEYSEKELAFIREKLKASIPPFNAETAPGLIPSVMAGIIANRLDLNGPSYVVDAACASALLALEIGVRDLLSGRCDAVITGGVQFSASSFVHMVFTQLGALTHRSHLRPFDKDADGTMIGEGIGMIVLKRLEDAEKDGHRIYAKIKGVGSSSDGKAKALLAPRIEGEILSLKRAYQYAGVDPASIGLVEAHGTSMPLGDLTEMQALRKVFGDRNGMPPSCAIGSVKSMIGHLLPAAGIAGLIKAALALYHKTLPPTLYCEKPNPELEIEKTPFYINSHTRPWIHGTLNNPRRAGVNSFGFGGINAHVVLEEYDVADETANDDFYKHWDTELFVFSAATREDLIIYCKKIMNYTQGFPETDLSDLAYTVNSTLDNQPYRLCVVAASLNDLREKTEKAIKRIKETACKTIKTKSGIYFSEHLFAQEGRVAFLFPGEGSQYANMLYDLCLHFPEVRSCFDTLDCAFEGHQRPYKPSHFIFPLNNGIDVPDNQEGEQLWQMDYAVDSVLAADRAIFNLLNRLEVFPQVILGHSSGEIMALEAAGAVQLSGEQERMEYIIAGNRMIQSSSSEKKIPVAPLIAVGVSDRKSILKIVDDSHGKLFIAMDNCPHQLVICSDKDFVSEAMEQMRQVGAICQELPFSRPYHTPLFQPAQQALEEFFGKANITSPKIELFSCVNAKAVPYDSQKVRELGVAQWTRQVRFRETIESMYDAGVRIFVEVGPKSNLTSFVNDILRGKPCLAVASNVHYRSGIEQLNHALGMLASQGVPMCLDYLYQRRRVVKLDIDMLSDQQKDTPFKKEMVKLSIDLPLLSLAPRDMETLKQLKPAANNVPKMKQQEVKPFALQDISSLSEEIYSEGFGHENNHTTPQQLNNQDDFPVDPDSTMGDPLDDQSCILEAHLQTMQQFLSVQQDIMSSFFMQDSHATMDAQISVNDFKPGFKSSDDSQWVSKAKNDIEPEGEVFLAKQRDELSDQPYKVRDLSEDMPSLQSGTSAVMSEEDITKLLFLLVSEKTGYPVDMFKPEHDLEADLGIDSIKRVEIFGLLKEKKISRYADDIDKLPGLKTFRGIIDFLVNGNGFKNKAGSSAQTSHDLPSMPLIGDIISHIPGREITAVRVFDLNEDLFLLNHTLGSKISVSDPLLTGLPMMPLTMSIEMLAEAASLIIQDKLCVRMKDVRAYQWISFENQKQTIRIHAKRQSEDSVKVEIRILKDSKVNENQNVGLPIAEGTIIFGDHYPKPPLLSDDDFILKNARPAAIMTQDKLYTEGMFTGPCFQGVASVDRLGENGIDATFKVISFDDFFKTQKTPQFVIDPSLLDAAGQLVGFWILDNKEISYNNVYPYKLDELHIYDGIQQPGAHVIGKGKITTLTENQLRSYIDIIGPSGSLLMRLIGWEGMSFHLPAKFHELRYRPQYVYLSEPMPSPVKSFSDSRVFDCCIMHDFPKELLHSHGMLWLNTLAFLALSRKERVVWKNLTDAGTRRVEWLLARIAGKDVLRLFIKKNMGIDLCMTDIEIDADPYGRPVYRGDWSKDMAVIPALSVTHIKGMGVAMISGNGDTCGIDVEKMDTKIKNIDQMTLVEEEREIAESLLGSLDLEWLLRIWCSKEAVGKALGRGLPGGPGDLMLQDMDVEIGMFVFHVSGSLAEIFPEIKGKNLSAYTLRDGDFVFAGSVYKKGDYDGK